MSLKNVHLAFIAAAVLLALFCGVQAAGRYQEGGSLLAAAGAAGSVVVAALLVRYETLFLRRCRAEGIR